MSTYKSIAETIQEIQYWLRLSLLLHEPIQKALIGILCNTSNDPSYTGLPTDPEAMYTELSTTYKNIIKKLAKKGIIRDPQLQLILPLNDNKTYLEKLDTTIVVILIRNCTTLPTPHDGWDNNNDPPITDITIAAFCIRAREWRNYLIHTEPSQIDMVVFQKKWNEGVGIVAGLRYAYDTNYLMTISLDPKHQLVLKGLFTFMGNLHQVQMKQQKELENQALHNQELSRRLRIISGELQVLQAAKSTPRYKNSGKKKNTYKILDIFFFCFVCVLTTSRLKIYV